MHRHLMPTTTGYWAFVPPALPPRLEASWELSRLSSEADRALGQLAGIAGRLPNAALVMRPFARREAVLSSRIEGTQASLSDLFLFEVPGATAEVKSRLPIDVREVANYLAALEYGVERLDELPLSLRLIRELHRVLMTGVRGEHQTPGEFRRSQNWIGPPNTLLVDATFVPPPVMEMNLCLGELEAYLHAPSNLPPLIRLAAIHYQFEAIHPFLDGNGRVGRLLVSLLLCHEKILQRPFLYLSAFFERRRDDYYQLLLAVSREALWSEWIAFFLEGVAEQARDALTRSVRLLDLREDYRARSQAKRGSALVLRLIDHLFETPLITVPEAARLLDLGHRAAGQIVAKLIATRVVEELPYARHPRLYLARGILQAIEQPLAAAPSA